MIEAHNVNVRMQMINARKIAYHCILPWINPDERFNEYELYYIPGDPTKDELQQMQKEEAKAFSKSIDEKYKNMPDAPPNFKKKKISYQE